MNDNTFCIFVEANNTTVCFMDFDCNLLIYNIMRKNCITFLLWMFLFSNLNAQNCGIPSQVSVMPTSHRSMRVSWNLPNANGSRLVLHRQDQIVNHPGEGWQGADLSVLYGGQTSLGVPVGASGYAMADDIRLTRQAQLTKGTWPCPPN